MYIKTVKIPKPKAVFAAAAAILVCLIVVISVIAGKAAHKEVYTLKTEAQRQEFLSSMGWKVSPEYEQCRVVTIPEEFNDVYNEYNKLQKEQGFDLSKYKGKTIEVYTYRVYNYPGQENEEIICSLMLCDGTLIGGDVCSTRLDGFMQGLRKA